LARPEIGSKGSKELVVRVMNVWFNKVTMLHFTKLARYACDVAPSIY
jgi:hypothetical protein